MNIKEVHMSTVATAEVMDVRLIPPPQRHLRIFAAYESLPVGGSFELHNDHDPVPLRQQFQELWPDLSAGTTSSAAPGCSACASRARPRARVAAAAAAAEKAGDAP